MPGRWSGPVQGYAGNTVVDQSSRGRLCRGRHGCADDHADAGAEQGIRRAGQARTTRSLSRHQGPAAGERRRRRPFRRWRLELEMAVSLGAFAVLPGLARRELPQRRRRAAARAAVARAAALGLWRLRDADRLVRQRAAASATRSSAAAAGPAGADQPDLSGGRARDCRCFSPVALVAFGAHAAHGRRGAVFCAALVVVTATDLTTASSRTGSSCRLRPWWSC